MNILFITPSYPKRGQTATGLPNYLYRMSLSLIQLGHKPVILAAGDENSHRIENGIEIWTVKTYSYTIIQTQTLRYIFNALEMGYKLNKKIKEIVQKIQIDVIQFPSLYGIALFYNEKVPAVLRLSSYAKTAFATYQTYSPMTVKIMSLFEIMSAYRCNAIFAPSKKNAELFGKDCNRKVKVIETPFINDVQEYDNWYLDKYLNGKKYILFFGSLYIEKGILVIADILEVFLRDNLEYYFVFLGDIYDINGVSSANLILKKAGIYAERVIIGNALPHKQLYPVIMHAEFIVLPSLMENLSNACIEAMYFEKVVIGTNGASYEQLITHGVNGLLCEIGNSDDLLNKMQSVVSMSSEEKKQMGKKAKRRIDKLKPEYTVNKLISLYEYIIEQTN